MLKVKVECVFDNMILTKSADLNRGKHLLIVGIDALALVVARVFLSQVLDEEHDGRISRLLFSVDSEKCVT